jgi:hypothetical protein
MFNIEFIVYLYLEDKDYLRRFIEHLENKAIEDEDDFNLFIVFMPKMIDYNERINLKFAKHKLEIICERCDNMPDELKKQIYHFMFNHELLDKSI